MKPSSTKRLTPARPTRPKKAVSCQPLAASEARTARPSSRRQAQAISQPLTANSGERSEPPSNRLRFNIPTIEETFKGERNAWRNAHKERQRKEARNRERGTGNRLDGLCHIDLQPCPRAAKCAFACVEVCTNFGEVSSQFTCKNAKSCKADNAPKSFACGIREANITE